MVSGRAATVRLKVATPTSMAGVSLSFASLLATLSTNGTAVQRELSTPTRKLVRS